MNIVIVSPSPRHLQDLAIVLEDNGHDVFCVEGGKSHLRAVVEQKHPDLLLADGMCCDPAELVQVEHVATHHPATAVVLMCSSQTPEFLLQSMRVGVREVLPSPPAPDALIAAVQRVAAKMVTSRPARAPGRVMSFMPCKGGSGATFIATNVAYEFSQHKSVLLIDLNLQFGDALSLLYDGRPASTLADVAANIDRLDASFLAASAVKVNPRFHVLAAPEDPTQALGIKPEQIDAILALAVRNYDYVVLDLGRNLDPVTIKALDRSWRVFIVLQATLPGVKHGQKLMDVFRSLGYPADKVEAIVNRYDRTAEIDLDHIQRALRTRNVLSLGNSYRDIAASINHGEPLLKAGRSNGVAKQLLDFAQALDPAPQDESRGLLGRLFRRA
jgi:pilus assembly protein CpaE